MQLRTRLIRNGIITYVLMGLVNYLGFRSRVNDPSALNLATTLIFWPASRIDRVSMVQEEISLVSVTVVQILILMIYFSASILLYGVEVTRRANKEAKEFLLIPEFEQLIDQYLYQKRDVIEQYPDLKLTNFSHLMDELILRDLNKLHEILSFRDFQISREGLNRALKIQSRPTYYMMLEELRLMEKRKFYSDFQYEISEEEIEKFK